MRHNGAMDRLDKTGKPLYDEGAIDKVLAKKCKCAISTVCYWRQQRGLPANAPTNSEDWRASHSHWFEKASEIIQCCAQGMTDAEGAAALNLKNGNAFRARRVRLGIKRNKPKERL